MAIKSAKDKIQEFKDDLSRLQQSCDQAKGALDTRMKTLKDDFGFNDIESAKKQSKKLEKELSGLNEKFDAAISDFEKKYKDLLEV